MDRSRIMFRLLNCRTGSLVHKQCAPREAAMYHIHLSLSP